MHKLMIAALSILLSATAGTAAEGLVNVPSIFTVEETADRMESTLQNKGMVIFNRINHSRAAGKVGIELRDTELIIFGNPKVGSPLMKCQQSVAIDLPQKALIWKDDQAQVWISYNHPGYLEKRHGINGCGETTAKIEKALAGIAGSAARD